MISKRSHILSFYMASLALLFISIDLSSQPLFKNPSFEGPSGNNSAAPQWFICSGTPDVLPPNMGGPNVSPSNGMTCLGMVNSLPGIEESVGQELFDTLRANTCYSFDIDLKYEPNYLAVCNPGRFRVWLGDSTCKKIQLAYISPSITHGVWRTYNVSFVSNADYSHLSFDLTHSGVNPVNVCMVADNIRNQLVGSSQAVDLGDDTTLCPSNSLILDATTPNTSYLWQDNSTNPTLSVNTAGLYWVEVTDLNGCTSRDSIQVDFEAELDLGNDTILCSGDSLLLTSNLVGNPNYTFLWQDNSTNSSLWAKDSAWYSLTVTSSVCVQVDSLLFDTQSDPNIDLGNDTSYCLGQTVTLDATAVNATSYSWSNFASTAQINVSSSGKYLVTVTVGVCDYIDSINLVFNDLNPFSLGADTTLCTDDSLILRAPKGTGFQYLWNDSSDDDTLVIKQAGKYWVDVSIGNCKETDTIEVSFSSFDQSLSNLGNDSILCNASSLLLDTTVLGATSYTWSDNSSNSSLLVTQAGDYLVTISNGFCSFVDSVRVSDQNLTPFDLGADTTLCPQENIILTAPQASGYNYLWQDNSTSASFNVTQSGKYWVDVFEGKCKETDTIIVNFLNFNPLELELGNDTAICPFDSLLINASVSWATSYSWEDNSSNPLRWIKNTGKYKVTVSNGNCQVLDSIQISYRDFSIFDLGTDTTLCLNDSLILSSPNLSGYTYQWQDNSSGSTFTVKQAGKYWLTASFGNCTYTDTIRVDYNSLFAPRPDLGPDTNLCQGVQLTLDATTANATNYRWHDGSTSNTFNASGLKDSLYSVEAFNGICVGSDTILVGGIIKSSIIDPPSILCEGKSLTLNISPSSGTHVWQDGTIGSSYEVLDSGQYKVVSTVDHCTFSDSLRIALQDCDCEPSLPNIITPNGDGVNDLLLLKNEFCEFNNYQLTVYNRFGKIMFQTASPTLGWDARSSEKKASEGQYFYLLEYSTVGAEKKVVKGTFTLLY